MVNITGNLISLSGSVTWSYSTSPYYYAWSSSQIDSVCQALKNLLSTNVPAFTVVKSSTNEYILTHSQLENGYAIRIYGFGSGSTTSESYVGISEGTWDGSSFTSKIYYYLKPYISYGASTGNNYQSGTITWSWNYTYRLLVDDDGKYFAITFGNDSVPANMFSYSYYDFKLWYGFCSYSIATNSYQSSAISSSGRFIFGVFPVYGTGYLTFFESAANTESAPFSAYLISGYASARYTRRISPTRGGTNNPNYIFYGWTIYNRKYVIASTMYPNLAETDYGEIKMVKLGVHEYGLPYIIDGLYLDNFFACERNSNLVNNQIIEIDGYKYLYCDSGYLFRLGVVPVVLDTPTISLSSDTLTITAVANANGYKVYKDGVLLVTSSNTTVDLSNYISVAGTYSITVRATSNDARYLDSDPSTSVSYTVAPQPLTAPTISLSGSTLTITAVAGAEGYKVYEGNNLIATVQTTTVDLSSYISAAGTYTITATAYATGISDSSASNSVTYSVISGYNVSIASNADTSYMDESMDCGFEVESDYIVDSINLRYAAPGSTLGTGKSVVYFYSMNGSNNYVTYTMGGVSQTVRFNQGVLQPVNLTGDMVITVLYCTCLTGDTLVTMADGTKKRLDEIKLDDEILSYDWDTMELVPNKVIFTDKDEGKTHTEYDVWTFDDGTIVKTVHRHEFYNVEAQCMKYMDEWKIGEHARKIDGTEPVLIAHETIRETVRHYKITGERCTNYFANGLLNGDRYCPNNIIFPKGELA